MVAGRIEISNQTISDFIATMAFIDELAFEATDNIFEGSACNC